MTFEVWGNDMSKIKKIRFWVAAPFLLLAPVVSAAEVEAKKDGVTVHASADKGAAVLVTLKSGESLEAGERKGMYWEVKTKDGKAGFVSVMGVKHKPGESANNLGAAIRDAVKDGRNSSDAANARSRSAVMGVRGLDESNETSFAGSVKPNLRAVYAMEDFSVGQKQLEGLGEEVFAEISRKAGGEKVD